MYKCCIVYYLVFALLACGQDPSLKCVTNSLGTNMVRIEPGSFQMGGSEGETLLSSDQWDERPVHTVTITQPFYMAATEVTNAQYEQFDPEHRRFRGLCGVSKEDNEAVVYVSWHDATAFCEWLSDKEGKLYRLPTEAEWEYACRAGKSTPYWMGAELHASNHRNQWAETGSKERNVKDEISRSLKGKVEISLQAGAMPPNPWGLREMHGNVEEWVLDWYGPYSSRPCTDPLGPADGLYKVTRGGSHNTAFKYLRSANRSATLPEDKHWLIGFRIVQAPMPDSSPEPSVPFEMNDSSVLQQQVNWAAPTDVPFFQGPIPFVIVDPNHSLISELPHHHHPTITWCQNGDLLAVWFATISEIGRECIIVGSRLRYSGGRWADSWDVARVFFAPADRNASGSCLLHDGLGRIYFFNAIGESSHHKDQCAMLSVSQDNGRTWSRPKIITDLFTRGKNSPMDSAFVENNGNTIVFSLDYTSPGSIYNAEGSGVLVSTDRGQTWLNQITGKSRPNVVEGGTGGLAAGFHICVVRLNDGRLMAMCRSDKPPSHIDGHMPKSYSSNNGSTWTYSATPFSPNIGGQRLALIRLREGPLFLATFFASTTVVDAGGQERTVKGMVGLISYDDGVTWPVKRLITDDGPPRQLDGGGNTGVFTLSQESAEPKGYLAVTQTPDNVIHLISSRLHYRFNLKWLQTPMPGQN